MITVTQFSAIVLKTARQHLSKNAPRQQPATEVPTPEEGTPPVEADGSAEAQASPVEAPAVEADGSAEAQATPEEAPAVEADAASEDASAPDAAADATDAPGA